MPYYESEKSERLGFCQTSDFIQAPEMDLVEERIVENIIYDNQTLTYHYQTLTYDYQTFTYDYQTLTY